VIEQLRTVHEKLGEVLAHHETIFGGPHRGPEVVGKGSLAPAPMKLDEPRDLARHAYRRPLLLRAIGL
jgi:hypothetical protein